MAVFSSMDDTGITPILILLFELNVQPANKCFGVADSSLQL